MKTGFIVQISFLYNTNSSLSESDNFKQVGTNLFLEIKILMIREISKVLMSIVTG